MRIPKSNFQREDQAAYAQLAAEFFTESDEPFFLSVNYSDARRPFLPQLDGLPLHPLSEADVIPMAYMGLDSPVL